MHHDVNQSATCTNQPGQSQEEYELQRVSSTTNQPAATHDPGSAQPSESPENSDLQHSPWKKWVKSRPHVRHVPLSAARDHLANERVFLAYIRTGSALSNFAVLILQLYRLKHQNPPKGKLSDHDLGIPFATTTLLIALAITLAGSWRFFASEKAMATRKQFNTSGIVVLVFMPTCVLVSFVIPVPKPYSAAEAGFSSFSRFSYSPLSLTLTCE
jgi:uncharacterized membrane protein YidH (DUF202 family)